MRVGCEVTWTVLLVRVGCLDVGGGKLAMIVFGIMIVEWGLLVDVGNVRRVVMWRLAMSLLSEGDKVINQGV